MPVRFPNGGDTQGLVADRDGAFHVGWINGVTGVLQLWYTKFELEPALARDMRAKIAASASGASRLLRAPLPHLREISRPGESLAFSTYRLDWDLIRS